DVRERTVDRDVVTPEVLGGPARVDVAEVEERVRAVALDPPREPLGDRAAVGAIAHGPDHRRLALGGEEREDERHADQGSTTSASLTARSTPSDGRFTTFPRTAIALDPPPSRSSASRAPSERITRAASASVTPALHPGARPSTVA